MTAPGWPYASFTDPAWLVPPGQDDPHLAACREAVRSLVGSTSGPAAPEQLLRALTTAQELADRIDWVLLSLVGEARGAGSSWERVAGALGVSKQAAHKRFGPYVAEAVARAAVPAARTPEQSDVNAAP
jgi:hypothetical protein